MSEKHEEKATPTTPLAKRRVGGLGRGLNALIEGSYEKKSERLGLMPHPENLIEAAHGGSDGRGIFESALRVAA